MTKLTISPVTQEFKVRTLKIEEDIEGGKVVDAKIVKKRMHKGI